MSAAAAVAFRLRGGAMLNLNDPSQMCRDCWNGQHERTRTVALQGKGLCQCPCHDPAKKSHGKKNRPVQERIAAPTIAITVKS